MPWPAVVFPKAYPKILSRSIRGCPREKQGHDRGIALSIVTMIIWGIRLGLLDALWDTFGVQGTWVRIYE